MQLCASLQLALQQITPNAFSLDLYYLAFPNDRRFIKYLVYGIYVIEFVQTILISHDVFATFGYGFGDMDTLAENHLYWFTVPIMSTVGARSNSYPFSVTYLKVQPLVWGRSSMHTESLYCQSHESSRYSSFVFVAVLFLRSTLAHLFTDIIDQLCGIYVRRHLRSPSRHDR